MPAYLAAEIGERAADLETVSPGSQGERTDLEEETSGHNVPKSSADEKKAKRLRAILRSPEVVQDLYRIFVMLPCPTRRNFVL